MHQNIPYTKLSFLAILLNLLLFCPKTYSQNEIKDCNGNPIIIQSTFVNSNNGSAINIGNCTFSQGNLSEYLNCIKNNNPSLPASTSLVVTLTADPASGISGADLNLLKQEVLQVNGITNTCNRVGSDTDLNNKLNTIDLCLIRKHNLGISNINPSWKFYHSQNLSLTGIGDTTTLVFPISDFPLSTLNIIGVHNGNVNQVSMSNDTCFLLCQPSLEIIAGTDIVRKPTPEYFLLNKSCSFPNLSLQILNESGQVIGNEITQNMVGSELTAQISLGNSGQNCITKLTVYPCETFVNIDVDRINTTDSTFVDVSVSNAEFIAGYQLSLKFDTTHLQFAKVEKGNEPGFNASNDANYNGNGHVNISRFKESSSLGLEEGTRLFRLKFKRKSTTVSNITIDPENVETLLFDINKNEYCPDITYLQDTNPPVCLQDTIILQGDQALGYTTIKFSDYASDDFGTAYFVGGVNEFDFPITNLDTFNCGTNILTYVTFKDANGLSKQCIYRVIVDCPQEACNNKYLYFDGINDRINIPNQHTGNVEFTIECWFKSDNTLDGGTADFHRIFTLGGSPRLEIGDRRGRIQIFNGNQFTIGPDIRDGLWHHLVLQRKNNFLGIFLDGNPINQSITSITIDLRNIRVGYFDNNNIQPPTLWKGGIDEIKLWNYPLSQEEINNSKNKISTIKKDCGLIGYWRMEEGIPEGNNQATTEIRDSVGTNHGTLVGFNLQGDQSNFLCNDSLSLTLDNEPCCQSSFSYSTNCNRINLSGNTEGFTNPSSITYNWTSTNTNFKSSAKDTVFNYFGDLPEVIICLEASDGFCSAIFCDTIPVTLPISPVFTGCPGSISLSSGDSCSLTFPINIPTATDPCTEMSAMVGCIRSDGFPLSAFFPLGVTTITCTASSVLGNEFDTTCEFDIEILDETKPICLPKNAEVFLDALGFTTFSPQLIDGGSSDNCGEISLSIEGLQTFNCVDVGNQIKTLIVTDKSNNTSTCQATIIVRDTIRPICNGKTLNKIINGNGNASFAAIDLNDNSSDNCGNLTFSASKTFFNCEDLNKTNMVILTVNDQSGNSSSCPVEVRLTDPNDYCGCLSDVTAPVCQSKNITLNLDASGNVNLTPELIDDGSFDVCSDITLQIEGASAFDCNSLGSQIVNLIVTDQANNTASCSADVIIQDKLKPTCSITTNFYLDQNGQVTLNKDHPNITLSDNCDIVNIISNPLMFTCNSIGSRFISLTVSDVSGNTNICAQNITIRDTIKPTCTIPPKTFYLQANGQVLITQNQLNITSNDNCFGVTSFFNNTNYNCNSVGMNPVSATVQDASGNMNTCFSLITIQDTIRPICRSKTINKIIGDNGGATILASELNNNSTDNCGNVTFTASKTIFNCTDVLNTNLVTLTVTDQSGNSSSCPVEVTILDPNEFCACLTDVTTPVCKTKNITLDLDINGNAILTPELINDGSFDACSDIMLQIEGASAFDCNSLGDQIVNLVVTDQSNNVSFCTATVTVQDKQLPNCILIPTLFHLDQTGNIMVTKDNLDISVSDNCSEVTTFFDALNFNCQDTGPQNIIVSVLDASGNTNVCSTLITITDTIQPTCSIESKTFYLSPDGQVNINQDQLFITSNDNCTGVTTAFNSINFNCDDLGVKNISATVLDVNGNTNICSAQITVSDSLRPTCSIPPRIIYLGSNGQASLSQAQLNITANDNCAGVTTTFNSVNFNCSDIGTKNIMATVRDVAGNTNACTAQIIIRDTIRPICIIRDTIVTSSDGTGAFVIFNGRAADNCAEGLTISYSQPADQFYPCGEYNIIMSARDSSGNTSTCPIKLTVKDCDGCCLSESSFMTNTDVDFNLSSDLLNADSCIIQFIAPTLTECQTVTEISWGDGTVSRGSFTNAVDFTHQYTEPAIYEVCVTYEEANQQNCFNNKKCNTFEVIDNCTLKRSSGQLDFNKIILVPNPTNRNFAISGGEIFTDYAIYDQLGREMVAKRNVESTNDISQLQNGVYFVRLTVGSINVTKRIIKIQ